MLIKFCVDLTCMMCVWCLCYQLRWTLSYACLLNISETRKTSPWVSVQTTVGSSFSFKTDFVLLIRHKLRFCRMSRVQFSHKFFSQKKNTLQKYSYHMTCAIYSKSKPIIFPIYYSLRISITALKSCSPLKCNQMKFFWQTVLHDRGLLCKLKHGGGKQRQTLKAP